MMNYIALGILAFCVFGGYIISGGKMHALWHPPELLIIGGGTFAAYLIYTPAHVLKITKSYLKKSFSSGDSKGQCEKLLVLLYKLFEVRRSGGASEIEKHIENPEESELFKESELLSEPRLVDFICDNIRLVILGNISVHELEAILDSEIHAKEEDIGRAGTALQTAGDALPGFGIVAAVLGIVITMQKMGGPVELLGASIATALVGTFLGILLGYGIVGPIAGAVNNCIKDEVLMLECIKESIIAHVSGRPSSTAVDAGRRVIYEENKPSFNELEEILRGGDE